ncbi:MAG: GNAT family N-acetyltransferase [Pirellulales bacterium]|nr:GNAT family N-acetyltransferase [Pirellulales bacterium]
MNDSPREIIDLNPANIAPAADVLARAFDDDPMTRYLLPDPKRRAARAPWMHRACLRFALRHGRLQTTPALAGLAVWIPPDGTSMGMWQAVQCGMLLAPFRLGPRTCGRLFHITRLGDRWHKRALPEPHWYLFMLAVDPPYQGQGVGSALLSSGLARADAEGTPVYLETTTEKNVRFYQKHGFDVVFRESIGKASLPFWGMIRKSR